jgi:hypothetical protein
MTIGEILILVFVALAFTFGIWGGLRLYKWNAKDRANLEEKNKNKKTQ